MARWDGVLERERVGGSGRWPLQQLGCEQAVGELEPWLRQHADLGVFGYVERSFMHVAPTVRLRALPLAVVVTEMNRHGSRSVYLEMKDIGTVVMAGDIERTSCSGDLREIAVCIQNTALLVHRAGRHLARWIHHD